MSAPRWAVKLKSGEYACVTCRIKCCLVSYIMAESTNSRAKARAIAKRRGGKIVRLLTPAESKRKVSAEALRALAADWRASLDLPLVRRLGNAAAVQRQRDADDADCRADALWPRKGAKS